MVANVFSIDNKKKGLLSSKSALISEGSSEDWVMMLKIQLWSQE